jgi:hypothetical protein
MGFAGAGPDRRRRGGGRVVSGHGQPPISSKTDVIR